MRDPVGMTSCCVGEGDVPVNLLAFKPFTPGGQLPFLV